MKANYGYTKLLYRIFLILGMAVLLTGMMPSKAQAEDLSALPRSIVITGQNQKTSYKIKSVPNLTLNGTSITCEYPLMRLDQVWMAAGEQLFRDKLGFAYSYNEAEETVTMRNPALDVMFRFAIGSEFASMNNEQITLNHAVVMAKDVSTGKKAVMLPLITILEKSHLSVKVTDNTIAINNDLLFHAVVLDDQVLDSSKYNNAVDGICIKAGKKEGERILYVNAQNQLSNADIIYTNRENATEIQITFPKTKNLLGRQTKSFSNGAVKKLEITEDNSYNTIITIEYKLNFIYSKKISGQQLITTFSVANFDWVFTKSKEFNNRYILLS